MSVHFCWFTSNVSFRIRILKGRRGKGEGVNSVISLFTEPLPPKSYVINYRLHTHQLIYIYCCNFFFVRIKLLKLFMSLECKYNKLQFGIRISSIEVSKQKLHISTSCHSTAKLWRASILQRDGIQRFSR